MYSARSVHKSYGAKTVLSDVSVAVSADARLGIVGPNGSGKSTLLRILAGEPPDEGEVVQLHPGVRVGLLPQQLPPLDATTWDAAVAGAAEVVALRAQWTSMANVVSQTPDRPDLLRQYGEVQEDLERLGGFHLEARVREVLHGLGLPELLWAEPVTHLSGGERTRLNLARTVLGAPNVLLLDEPTNHLDVPAIEWLETFLVAFHGAVVVASHDRRFLDTVALRIVEIDSGRTRNYPGNYTAYQVVKDRELRAQVEAYARYRQEVERLRDFVRRQMARAAHIQSGPKAGRDYYGKIAKKVARRGQAARKRLARLEQEALQRPWEPGRVRVQLAAGEGPGEVLLHLRNVTKRFGSRVLFTDVNLSLGRGERVGLIGLNGAGKTTLLRIMTGDDMAIAGEVWRGPSVRPGYLPQEQTWLSDHQRALDVVTDAGLSLPDARALLASLLFRGDRVFERVGNLSGGERTRLALAILIQREANLLLLDEPTNHLDLPSRERFEEALDAYEGTLVIASHDRFLLDRLCTVIWSIEGTAIRIYPGNYTDFRARSQPRQ